MTRPIDATYHIFPEMTPHSGLISVPDKERREHYFVPLSHLTCPSSGIWNNILCSVPVYLKTFRQAYTAFGALDLDVPDYTPDPLGPVG